MSKAKDSLQKLGKELVEEINKEKPPQITLPVRALSNVVFDKKTKTLKIGEKETNREFFNLGHAKKFLQTLEVAKISKTLIDEQKHSSLRDVFYMAKRTIPQTNVNIVDEQPESDKVIEDLELITNHAREELHIEASKSGFVAGKVIIEDRGDTIDWSRLGSGGWSIPSNVEDIKFKKVDAKFILYMEKDAVWNRLHEDKFWQKYDCVIMGSRGQTTRGIRRLLQRMAEEFNIPIYVLCDWDIYGAYIYSVIKYGSIALAYASEKLTIPQVKYLGITAQDIEKYGLQKHFIKLKDVDKSRMKQVSEYDWFKNNKAWQHEFKMMKEWGAKAEIQSLSSRGISFITEKYLPEKLKNKDFLE